MPARTLSRCNGFTLIELLVVTSIIGILASLAIPQFAAYRARSFDAKVAAAVRHVATGEEAFYTEERSYTSDLSDLSAVIVDPDVEITISAGNSGDIASSFKIHGSHAGAAHEYDWVSDPGPGDPNFFITE
jgi:prepilin-type N-terminal cleavage/methylation domain-containing protein